MFSLAMDQEQSTINSDPMKQKRGGKCFIPHGSAVYFILVLHDANEW